MIPFHMTPFGFAWCAGFAFMVGFMAGSYYVPEADKTPFQPKPRSRAYLRLV